jgi:hypothetical protein
MTIHIETIPHHQQRYPTVGDYWEEDGGTEQVRVSELPDWRYEALIAVHEMVEMILTKHRNISEEMISAFDIAFERDREAGKVLGEPGDDPRAPYRREHFFATNLERLLAAELGVDWGAYETLVDGLGVKK